MQEITTVYYVAEVTNTPYKIRNTIAREFGKLDDMQKELEFPKLEVEESLNTESEYEDFKSEFFVSRDRKKADLLIVNEADRLKIFTMAYMREAYDSNEYGLI
jgi:DNA transposition AAA+ family ATPase